MRTTRLQANPPAFHAHEDEGLAVDLDLPQHAESTGQVADVPDHDTANPPTRILQDLAQRACERTDVHDAIETQPLSSPPQTLVGRRRVPDHDNRRIVSPTHQGTNEELLLFDREHDDRSLFDLGRHHPSTWIERPLDPGDGSHIPPDTDDAH
jgi:hypothetical protein